MRGGVKIGEIYVDAVVSESHQLSSTVAQHALEDGASVADHVILNPRKLSVSLAVGNVDGRSWPTEVYNAVTRAWKERQPFDVITHHVVLHNMVVESATLDTPDGEGNAYALAVEMTLAQLNFAGTNLSASEQRHLDSAVLPETEAGVAATPEKDAGITVADEEPSVDINREGVLEEAALGELSPIPQPEPPGTLASLEDVPTPQTPEAAKPKKLPVSWDKGNVRFSSPVAKDTFNRFRAYSSYAGKATHVLLDVLDVDGNPLRRGINVVAGKADILEPYDLGLKLNVVDFLPQTPVGKRVGTDTVQTVVGMADTPWPKIEREG